MGNQNTSGITPEAPEIARVGSTHDQGSEAAEIVSEGPVNEDPETQTNDLPNGSIDDHVEPKGTCFEEQVPELNDEMQDQPFPLKEIANPEDSPSLVESADENELVDSEMSQSDEAEIDSDKIGLKAPPEDDHISSDETILENAVITEPKKEENESEKLGRVELRKFPSFDFVLEKTTEESERTPLLYNDNNGDITTPRSFSSRSSSSSGLQPQNRSIQIEHQEAAEAEEKTMIRMESSTMDDLSLNKPNNDSVPDKEKGIALEGSPRSTKGSEKRKPRSSSSLFTTCMCCTAVIN